QPIGFCCERCINYRTRSVCPNRFNENSVRSMMRGFCIGCKRDNVFLVWMDLTSAKGMCRICFIKYDRTMGQLGDETDAKSG
ncbi:MAG: hypothetical protein ACTSQQ_13150, partial [Candidatus Helarchaeota archaeon]